MVEVFLTPKYSAASARVMPAASRRSRRRWPSHWERSVATFRESAIRLRELATAQDWATTYRSLFGLPRVHVTAPGFVVLPLIDSIAAINTPEPLGVLILGELTIRGVPGPVLVRERPPRRTFLVVSDGTPSPDRLTLLERNGIDIGLHRGNVILPTSFGRHTQEGRWWARAPQRDESLPFLSEVVAAITSIL
ncbi:hypothetical protein HLB23_30945 [Nocardia uniformis]|uniref:Uncharacterized protein n=2 Tax=Nocardia uniformis TaxID=53432 RepID=A0A849C907_9NOCA|nr:hypothetical protein [Nocardia uniformis]NNH74218.1 hypothetical protein [Nocardia uniformis]